MKQRIVALENLCAAADEFNRARPLHLRRDFDIAWLNDIATDLANDRFVWDAPREKDINEGGKIRHLRIPSLRSTVAQIAIFRVLSPIIDSRLPEMSMSSRKGRGGHALARMVSRFVRTHRRESRYCIYFDIRKYYDHIKIGIAVERLRRIVKDEWVLDQMRGMFSNTGDGLPIGYVGAHQLANLYVADIFRTLRNMDGIAYGAVYMDNFTFMSAAKSPLARLRKTAIRLFAERGLHIKQDWQIFPVAARGVRAGGFVLHPHHSARLYRRIHHRAMRNMDRMFETCAPSSLISFGSRFGWYMQTRKMHIVFDKLKKEKSCTRYMLLNALPNLN